MSIRNILRLGHPLLRSIAKPVEHSDIDSQSFQSLLKDMSDTLDESGGIGIAAPQIGVSLQLALIHIKPDHPSRYGRLKPYGPTFFLNPVIESNTHHYSGYWEGCLSVPGLRGFVLRPDQITLTYHDLNGDMQQQEITGFLAHVVAHELDHLQGKLFVDHIHDTHKLAFTDEFDQFIAPHLNPNID